MKKTNKLTIVNLLSLLTILFSGFSAFISCGPENEQQNEQPSIDTIADQTVVVNTTKTVEVNITDTNDDDRHIVNASSENRNVATVSVDETDLNLTGTVELTIAGVAEGLTVVTISVTDDSGQDNATAEQVFEVTVWGETYYDHIEDPGLPKQPQQPSPEESFPITISEIMYGSEARFSPPQWIELSNTGKVPVNMTGWKLTIQNVDSEDLTGPVSATIVFKDDFWGDVPKIWPNETLLIVTDKDNANSGGFMDDQIFSLRWRGELGIGFWDTFLSAEGFYIKLTDRNGNLVDEAGNYDRTKTLWDLPYDFNRGRIRAGNRTSLLRRYANSVVLDGTKKESWMSAVNANLTEEQKTYYGDKNDISSPGILGPKIGE